MLPYIAEGVDKLFVFGIIVSIGMSLGGLTGYAINPARVLHMQYFLLKEKVILTSVTVWSYRLSDRSLEQLQLYYYMEQFRGKKVKTIAVIAIYITVARDERAWQDNRIAECVYLTGSFFKSVI